MSEIPQSPALAEAGSGAESLAELLSRDPESYTEQNLTRIIEALREQRARWAAAESGGKTTAPRAPKSIKAPAGLTLESLANED